MHTLQASHRACTARRLLPGLLAALLAPAWSLESGDQQPTAGAEAPAQDPPPGTWSAATADHLERELDAFMADNDASSRRHRYDTVLLPAQVGLSFDELQAMAAAPSLALGTTVRLSADWQASTKDARGWFNLALPAAYAPGHACGLVIAMHGSNSDADNLPSFYTQSLTQAGWMVLYPTTSDREHYWEDPVEVAGVFRLVEWVAHHYRIDFRHLVISGASMGGMGTWSYLLEHPELWSAGAAVAGAPPASGEILEHLRGTPFYVLHGALDTNGVSLAPVERVRTAIAEVKARGIEVTYVEVPDAAHTPPMPAWVDMCAWIAKQPPKAWSPRPLFLPKPGDRPLSAVELDPLGLASDDPALALIRGKKARQAIAVLSKRIATDPSRLNLLYRALAYVPGVQDAIAHDATAASFTAERGWGRSDEHDALKDLDHAIHLDKSPSTLFATTAYLWAARIHAKQFLLQVDQGGTAWVDAWQAFLTNIQAAMAIDPSNREAAQLAVDMGSRLPANLRPQQQPPQGGTGQQ
jgi:predicted esterase